MVFSGGDSFYRISLCFPFWGHLCLFGQIQLNVDFVDFKKNAQCECGELSLIGGKMRAAAQDAAMQVALRNYSEEARGGARLHKSFATKGR